MLNSVNATYKRLFNKKFNIPSFLFIFISVLYILYMYRVFPCLFIYLYYFVTFGEMISIGLCSSVTGLSGGEFNVKN